MFAPYMTTSAEIWPLYFSWLIRPDSDPANVASGLLDRLRRHGCMFAGKKKKFQASMCIAINNIITSCRLWSSSGGAVYLGGL